MPNLFRRFLGVLAGSTRNELRGQIQFLKAENELLRARVKGRVRLKPPEKARLLRLGKPLGRAASSIVSIVRPETYVKWVREAGKRPKKHVSKRKPGRPRTPEQIRRIILRIARETGFGYVRILGELRNLGIGCVSRSTVVNILREAGLPTGPVRGEQTWSQFLKAHAKTLWACDFMMTRILTRRGFRYAFSLVFVHPETRRSHISSSTIEPNVAWLTEVVRRFVTSVPKGMHRPRLLIRDRDGKFRARDGAFDALLRRAEIKCLTLPQGSPNLNAHVERLIQSVQLECLDHFIILGTRHLDHLLSEYSAYHNRERPHSSLGFSTPMGRPPPVRAGPVDPRQIRCRERPGGVIKHYFRAAA